MIEYSSYFGMKYVNIETGLKSWSDRHFNLSLFRFRLILKYLEIPVVYNLGRQNKLWLKHV